MWHCWISETVERDENVKRDKTIDFVALLNMWDYWLRHEWELVNTTEFVTLLNKWDCWRKWECKTR